MQQIICRGHKIQEGHTLTKLYNEHNSCYSSQLLTLPKYIQHGSKIIILTTVLSHIINNRTLVLLKEIKYYQKQVLCVWKKFVENILPILYVATKI